MNYEPNKIKWKAGDLVIHDYDAKETKMLMLVVDFYTSSEGKRRYKTVYIHQSPGKKGEWDNSEESLHDPVRFKISVEKKDVLNLLIINWYESSVSKKRKRA